MQTLLVDLYIMLTKINLYPSRTELIEEGTFNKQDKLVYLVLNYCPIKQLPRVIGPSVHSIETWSMWHRFDPNVLTYPYFSTFKELEVLSLSEVDIGNLEPATLPPNLGLLYLASFSDMSIFPNISNSLHMYKIITNRGQLQLIPQEHMLNLPKLYDVLLNDNQSISFPNLSHLELHLTQITSIGHILSMPGLVYRNTYVGWTYTICNCRKRLCETIPGVAMSRCAGWGCSHGWRHHPH